MLSSPSHLCILCARAQRALMAERLNGLGLASGEDLVLAELWREDGLTQAELARRLMLRRSTVTTVLRTMARRGLVDRVPDERDRRAIRVHHTKRAASLRPALAEVWRDAEAELLRGLGREERVVLTGLLKKLLPG